MIQKDELPINFEGLGMCFYRVLNYRHPRKGEFYLSGAIVEAWKAPNDLPDLFWVVEPTYKAVKDTIYKIGDKVEEL